MTRWMSSESRPRRPSFPGFAGIGASRFRARDAGLLVSSSAASLKRWSSSARRPKVIKHLNKGLRHELTAINQYWLHYRLLANWGLSDMAKVWRKESIEEMQYADRIADRVIFLEGLPKCRCSTPCRSVITSGSYRLRPRRREKRACAVPRRGNALSFREGLFQPQPGHTATRRRSAARSPIS